MTNQSDSTTTTTTSTSTSTTMTDHTEHKDVYCYCLHASLCHDCGKPRSDRAATTAAIEGLLTRPRPARSNVYGHGPLLVSDIPHSASPASSTEGIVLGIDEAGRGSVLGPMVYGLAYWSVEAADRVPKSFNDSKQLSEETRNKLWDEILAHEDIGFSFKALLPNEISRNMLRERPYNLNEQSHDTAMTLIRKLLDQSMQIQTCFIDTVGHAGHYKRKLEQTFPGIEFVVESKADANYAPCSAASVVAKVMRDRMLREWQCSDVGLQETIGAIDYGSGYPSDPKCKAWMDQALRDPVFGYDDFIRFSWAPAKSRLSGDTEEQTCTKAVSVTFAADLDEDETEDLQQQKGMSAFLSSGSSKGKRSSHGKSGNPGKGGRDSKRKRSSYFERQKLRVISAF